jgi:hypothetical protein
MREAVQLCAYLIGLPLELMVIAALVRGEYRRYPFLFLYAVADFLITVLEIQPALAYGTASAVDKKGWAIQYWIHEQIMQVLVFLLVISLFYSAAKHLRPRRTILTAIVCGTAMVAAISFLAHYDVSMPWGRWMTRFTRDLNFCAAILLVGLWTVLISARQKDYKLLMITGGLGIQFAGGAIGQALRDMSPAIVAAANDFTVIANLACLYIWWQALRVKSHSASHVVNTQ